MSHPLQHLSRVLNVVATYNAERNNPCPVGILVPLVGGRPADIHPTIGHAEREGLIKDAGGHRYWITCAGGDVLDAERSETPIAAMAVHSDGDIN